MGENSKDGKGRGGCCGTFVGCAVLLATAAGILIGVFIAPMLKKNNWSVDTVKHAVADLVERIEDWYDDITDDAEEAVTDTANAVKKQTAPARESVADVLPGVISD